MTDDDTQLNEAEAAAYLEHVQQRGLAIFSESISLTWCATMYVTVVGGRLYAWNTDKDAFQLALSVPQPDGTVDLLLLEHFVARPSDIESAARTADDTFHDRAQFPYLKLQRGEVAEDLFWHVCLKLGFKDALKSPDKPYTIRRGTQIEDKKLKIDFVFTFANPEPDRARIMVPLQLTTAHGVGHPDKQEAVDSGRVAYLPLDTYLGYPRAAISIMKAANRFPNGRDMWLMSQVIQSAAQKHVGHRLRMPIVVPVRATFPDDRAMQLLLPFFNGPLQQAVNHIFATVSARDERVVAFYNLLRLRMNRRKPGTIYNFERIPFVAPTSEPTLVHTAETITT